MTFSRIYFFSGTWTPLVAVIITLIPGKYLFMSWRPHLCQSTSLVFKVKRPARHLKTFLLLHLKKRKGPSQWRLPKVITTKELGSSIFQEIILNHKCPPHCHCLHGFRNSEHVKKNPICTPFMCTRLWFRKCRDLLICKIEEWVRTN